jgi:hypothetical protein
MAMGWLRAERPELSNEQAYRALEKARPDLFGAGPLQ